MCQNQSKMKAPRVVSDPRFKAARALATASPDKAVDVFAGLLEDAIDQFGPEDIETSILYYEYGNAILRAQVRRETSSLQEEDRDEEDKDSAGVASAAAAAVPSSNDSKTKKVVAARALSSSASLHRRTALAEAAEKRRAVNESEESVAPGSEKLKIDVPEWKEPAEVDPSSTGYEVALASDDATATTAITPFPAVQASGISGTGTEDDDTEDDDAELALEMMETCYSIFDQYSDSLLAGNNADSHDYGSWVTKQIPRVLTGIGDALSHLNRHADAADAYLRAVKLWQAVLERIDIRGLEALLTDIIGSGTQLPPHRQPELIELLVCRRKLAESNVLVAEELLAHLEQEGPGRGVVTSETREVLVPAGEQADYASGYYESSREQLQEAVMLIGQLKAKFSGSPELEEERENVCFAATLIMGVGEALEALKEKAGARQPSAKRLKT
jgi:tetratricopeptide (TPR) repeat protein